MLRVLNYVKLLRRK